MHKLDLWQQLSPLHTIASPQWLCQVLYLSINKNINVHPFISFFTFQLQFMYGLFYFYFMKIITIIFNDISLITHYSSGIAYNINSKLCESGDNLVWRQMQNAESVKSKNLGNGLAVSCIV